VKNEYDLPFASTDRLSDLTEDAVPTEEAGPRRQAMQVRAKTDVRFCNELDENPRPHGADLCSLSEAED
jgi:hypothetical protein